MAVRLQPGVSPGFAGAGRCRLAAGACGQSLEGQVAKQHRRAGSGEQFGLAPAAATVLALCSAVSVRRWRARRQHTRLLGCAFAGQSRAPKVARRPPGVQRSRRTALAASGGPEEIECDVVIVGSGPAGCTCALYTSRADHKTVMLDKNPATGALAITSTIANYPGVETTMSGAALLEKMRDQAVSYGTEYRRAQVFLVDQLEGETKVVLTPEATIKAKVIVLATGAMGRKPSFAGEEELLGQGVSYCATCDGAFYRDSEVAVVGTNKEAVEEALFLTKFASTVHWITPNDHKKAEGADDLLAKPNVKHWGKTRLLKINGDDGGVTGVQVQPRDAEDPQELPVEGVFIYVAGSQPMTDFLQGKVKLKEDGGVWVDSEMATSIPGVFAIGDIRNTPFKQVVVAASDGCIAAMAIDKYLRHGKRINVDWIHK